MTSERSQELAMLIFQHDGSCYYLSSCNQAHREACFIKVVDIFMGDAIGLL
jgi:hypothetical protein